MDRHDAAQLADRLADAARRRGVDAFEARGEATRGRLYVMERGGDWTVIPSATLGVSIRVWREGAAAHAALLDPEPEQLDALIERAERLASAAARHRGRSFAPVLASARASSRPEIHGDPFDEGGHERIVGLLRDARAAASAVAPRAQSTRSSFSCSDREVFLVNSAGGTASTRQYHAGMFAQVIVKENGRAGDHAEIEGGLYGIDDLRAARVPERLGEEAARIALEGARAEPVKAGRYRVLVDNEMSGLLAHESFGHLTEFDLMTTGWSVLHGKVGARLADARLSIVDAPTPIGGRVGVSVPVDDEGTRGRDVRILDKGVFALPMHQRDSARASDVAPTGNGRALNVRHPPIVRMRNTFVEPGDMSVQEAIEALGDGVYLRGGRGGSPHSDGSFMFTSAYGYRVEKGEIVAPVKSTSMVGNILHFLPHVEGITRDFRMFSNTFAGCGKWEQAYLHVAMGGPHVLASDVLLGGHLIDGGAGA